MASTALGPLTTTFTAPLGCSKDAQELYRSGYLFQGPKDQACFPSGYVPNNSAYYSPGVCPSGYTIACSHNSFADETIITCCPDFVSGRPFSCQIANELDLHVSFLCVHKLDSSWTLEHVLSLVEDATITLSTFTGIAGGGINAYGVQVRYDPGSSVVSTLSSTLIPPLRAAGTEYSTSTQPPSTTTFEPLSDDYKNGNRSSVSPGAVAGIAVGGAIVGSVLASLAGFCIFKYRNRSHSIQRY
ncbi:hypothetical protein F5B20DRAFT_563220 [Whalleya microplaca]|nr:hypothetical protein F5B20DRAFT_563220 [Whalleya microplaca]